MNAGFDAVLLCRNGEYYKGERRKTINCEQLRVSGNMGTFPNSKINLVTGVFMTLKICCKN